MPVESKRLLPLFGVQLQRPVPRVASAFPEMAEERHYRQGFQRLSGQTRALPLFSVQTPTASSSGHKSTQLCGKERHFADLPYARQS
ncbi:hypothetical protein QOZ98_000557 [Planomicrobium stackebrandtii]|uniref:Uncharacterized protein n=1 Tax=Planomicrobium stackebrandtii TaxID=253160 RepID=A0ABU0GT38_9BACL|nr:hypothetical protein [Planomicrobium stackebrandtii]MDQ0427732.1 hypothetical protein [Planomicrobium stackebrandtii]